MRTHLLKGRVLPVVIGAAALIGAANLGAYAANGHPLLLGHANAETSTAGLSNSGTGPALSIHTSKKSPPFAVNSGKTVKRLNADRVDGQHAADLETRATTWRIPVGPMVQYALDGLPSGTYQTTLDVTVADTDTATCYLFEQGTDIGLLATGVSNGTHATVSGAGLLIHHADQELTLTCSGTDYTEEPASRNTITMLRLDRVKHSKPHEVARTGGRGR